MKKFDKQMQEASKAKPVPRLPKAIMIDVSEEVSASFTPEELTAFESFEQFWDLVDAQNAFEEEWTHWKTRGIVRIYRLVYEDLRARALLTRG